MSPITYFDTSSAIHLRSPSLIPTGHLKGAFSSSITTHGIQPTQHEAVWSLPPQGDSEGPQNLHQLHSTAPPSPGPTYRAQAPAPVAYFWLRASLPDVFVMSAIVMVIPRRHAISTGYISGPQNNQRCRSGCRSGLRRLVSSGYWKRPTSIAPATRLRAREVGGLASGPAR